MTMDLTEQETSEQDMIESAHECYDDYVRDGGTLGFKEFLLNHKYENFLLIFGDEL